MSEDDDSENEDGIAGRASVKKKAASTSTFTIAANGQQTVAVTATFRERLSSTELPPRYEVQGELLINELRNQDVTKSVGIAALVCADYETYKLVVSSISQSDSAPSLSSDAAAKPVDVEKEDDPTTRQPGLNATPMRIPSDAAGVAPGAFCTPRSDGSGSELKRDKPPDSGQVASESASKPDPAGSTTPGPAKEVPAAGTPAAGSGAADDPKKAKAPKSLFAATGSSTADHQGEGCAPADALYVEKELLVGEVLLGKPTRGSARINNLSDTDMPFVVLLPGLRLQRDKASKDKPDKKKEKGGQHTSCGHSKLYGLAISYTIHSPYCSACPLSLSPRLHSMYMSTRTHAHKHARASGGMRLHVMSLWCPGPLGSPARRISIVR
jgi:hypothetical protein